MFTQKLLAAGTAAIIGQGFLHIAMHVNATHASNHAGGIAIDMRHMQARCCCCKSIETRLVVSLQCQVTTLREE